MNKFTLAEDGAVVNEQLEWQNFWISAIMENACYKVGDSAKQWYWYVSKRKENIQREMLNERLLIFWNAIIQILIDILLTSNLYNNSLVQELRDVITYRSSDLS